MSTGKVLLLLGCMFAFATGHWIVGILLIIIMIVSALR